MQKCQLIQKSLLGLLNLGAEEEKKGSEELLTSIPTKKLLGFYWLCLGLIILNVRFPEDSIGFMEEFLILLEDMSSYFADKDEGQIQSKPKKKKSTKMEIEEEGQEESQLK